jgi:hypothetical protein
MEFDNSDQIFEIENRQHQAAMRRYRVRLTYGATILMRILT